MAKRLQASQFPGLIPEAQKNIKNVETVAKIVANVEEQASVTKKQGRAKSKKEPLIRGSYTFSQSQLDYIEKRVEQQIEEGINANMSHYMRQLIQAEMKRNPLECDV